MITLITLIYNIIYDYYVTAVWRHEEKREERACYYFQVTKRCSHPNMRAKGLISINPRDKFAAVSFAWEERKREERESITGLRIKARAGGTFVQGCRRNSQNQDGPI